jgi:hypothetical protein
MAKPVTNSVAVKMFFGTDFDNARAFMSEWKELDDDSKKELGDLARGTLVQTGVLNPDFTKAS